MTFAILYSRYSFFCVHGRFVLSFVLSAVLLLKLVGLTVLFNKRFFNSFLSSTKFHVLPEIHSFLFLVEYHSSSFPVLVCMLITPRHISFTPVSSVSNERVPQPVIL